MRAELAAAETRRGRERQAEREKRFDALAGNPEAVWSQIDDLIETKKPRDYDIAVELLKDLQAIAHRAGQGEQFVRRYRRLRDQHLRKPRLISRFDSSGLPR